MNEFASADPHRVRVFPYGAEESVKPHDVRVIRRFVFVEVLKDGPVSDYQAAMER